jgi:two-component system, chemotaxis family, protein-glutamate methylesterase/glutaminase
MTALACIGASWGGMESLPLLLQGFSSGDEVAVAVAQHRHSASRDELARALQRRSALRVTDVEDKDPIEPGRVYLAPADYHLLVEPGRFALSTDAHIHYSRPSIDVLFERAADAYGELAIGIVLTGTGQDGIAGLRRIKERGGTAIVEDPSTAVRGELPAAAAAAVAADAVLPLGEIAPFVHRLVMQVAA